MLIVARLVVNENLVGFPGLEGICAVYNGEMKVDKEKFDSLLGRLLRQPPAKTQVIKGTPGGRSPIIPKPSVPR